MSGLNLKTKLLTAFLVIILIPVLLIAAATGAIVNYQVNSIEQDYGVNTNVVTVVTNPLKLLNRATRGVYNEIKLAALKYPDQLENEIYLKELNDRLLSKYSFLIVRKGTEYIYSGNESLAQVVEQNLPLFGNYSTEVDGGIYIGGDPSFLVKQQDFYCEDGSEGTVFVVTDVNVVMPQTKWFLIQLLTSVLAIICLTAMIMVVWIYRGIVKPLNKLRRATYEIREGNLEYEIKEAGDDEIGQLCSDFEEMRIRLKELIDAKLKSERDSKELFSNISHDLKTPLTAIKGYTEGIMDGVADTPEKRDRYLKTIYKKASDMAGLVDELLYYTKIDADSVTYNFSQIDIGDYFEDCLEEYSFDVQSQNLTMNYENDVCPGTKVIADAEQIKRVINNIVGNSIKYMSKEQGTISIKLSELNEDVKIEISDNGVGIPAKDLPHIFDRFYRADASRNSRKGGSGLGLAIAKKIIEDHGGIIWADSKENEGTTTGFTLKKVKEDTADE